MLSNFLVAMNAILPLLVYLLLGYGLRAAHILKEDFTKQMTKLVFTVNLPILVFNSIYSTNLADDFNRSLAFYAIGSFSLLFFVLTIFIPLVVKNNGRRGALIMALSRSNALVIGLPLMINLYGANNVGMIALVLALTTPFSSLYSVIVLSIFAPKGKKMTVRQTLTSVFLNPLIIGSVLGLLVALTGLKFPTGIETSLTDLALITTPLALIALGADFKFSALKTGWKLLTGISLFKLLVIPGLLISIGILLGFRGVELATLICLYATPNAVSNYALAVEMDSDDVLTGQAIVFTTIVAPLTLFIILVSLMNVNLL